MNMTREAKIGTFSFQGKEYKLAVLNCYTPWNTQLSIDVLDKQGRSYYQKSCPLETGKHELVFNLPKLPSGSYNVWISMGEKTAIQAIEIPKAKGGLFSRLMG
jgi:hypothetical protein